MLEIYETLLNKDGTLIYYYKNLPTKPKAIMVISHGYGGHSGQYQYITSILNQHNYGVYALDHRGQGRSQTERGHLEHFEDFLKDFAQLIDLITLTSPGMPIYTLGHSMGGLIAYLYGLTSPQNINGQIFSAPALGMPWGTRLIPAWFFTLSKKFFPRLKVYPILKRKACRDKLFLEHYRKDSYTLKYATTGFFCEFIAKGIKMAAFAPENYLLPCLFLHGKGDRIIPYKHSVDIFNKISSPDKTLQLYEELYHELLQEPERDSIIQDILLWLEKQGDKGRE